MDPAAQAHVCALAPDPGRDQLDQHPLWLLNKMNNRDKHREILIVACVIPPSIGIQQMRGGYFHLIGPAHLQPGAGPVAMMEWDSDPYFVAQVGAPLQVTFDKATEVGDRQVVPALRGFHDHVQDAVFKRLEKHL